MLLRHASPQQGACCSPRAIHKQQPLCLLDRFSSVCVRHILVSVRCSLFDQHVSRRLPEHLPSVLQFASAVFDSFGVGDTVAVAARGVACGGLAEVEEMAEGEALGAVCLG